jgi:hypothetical protein
MRQWILLFALFLFFPLVSFSGGLYLISDEISHSWPGSGSDHTISFRNSLSVPPSGKIVVKFDPSFDFPEDLGVEDFDFLLNQTQKPLFTVPTQSDSGVEISTSTKEIVITLAQSLQINSGTLISIKIGKNANYQATGNTKIINPSQTGSFKISIQTFDQNSNFLERGEMMVAILEPVHIGASPLDIYPPVRYEGRPTGTLIPGTRETMLSLYTHEPALCKYATEPDIPYEDMTSTISTTYKTFHDTVISGLQDGTDYKFYVKCIDVAGNANPDDYIISFSVMSPGQYQPGPGPPGPGPPGPGPPGPGGGGTGPVAGGAPYPPDTADVIFEGVAYYKSEVTILKDGQFALTTFSNEKGGFSAILTQLPKGIYTFGIKAKDSKGRESVLYSLTITLRPQTRNTISGIFVPPTIEISSNKVNPGEILRVFGEATPNSTIELWVYPSRKEKVSEFEIQKATTSCDAFGNWETKFDTSKLSGEQIFSVKARAFFTPKEASDFSRILEFGLGKTPQISLCARSDLNKDGKVNLVDFSILLYWWGSSNPTADINMDRKVNLTDFSIMMYCWTG